MSQGRLPALTPREVIRILERVGFLVVRQTGSHVVMRHPATSKSVAIPAHRRDLKRGTLLGIMREAGVTREELLDLL